MSKKKKKKSGPPGKPFTKMPSWEDNHYVTMFDDQMNSKIFTSLTASAKVVYLILRQQYKGEYSGYRVACPYSTFADKGMRRNTVANAIDQLEIFGFVDINRGGIRHMPNYYTFSERWKEKSVEEAKAEYKNAMDKKKLEAISRKEYKERENGRV